MNIPQISVVIPVYRVEKYLNNCISSVLDQSFKDIEVILVDDGSPDNSGLMCDDWALKDDRIRVFHQKNSGVTAARRYGVQQARGEWISFVDSDDSLPLDSLECLWTNLGDADMVKGLPFVVCQSTDKKDKCGVECKGVLYDKNNFIMHCLHDWRLSGPWASLYRRSVLVNGILDVPRNIVCGEDGIMNLRYAMKISKIKFIPVFVYNYHIRESSATHLFYPTLEYEKQVDSYLQNAVSAIREDLKIKEALFLRRYQFIRGWYLRKDNLNINDEYIADVVRFFSNGHVNLEKKIFCLFYRYPNLMRFCYLIFNRLAVYRNLVFRNKARL